jgi:uncharacterized protein
MSEATAFACPELILGAMSWLSMEVHQFVFLGAILCAGIFVQSATGFAAGLLIIPLLLFSGFSLPESQCAMLVASVPQNVWGVWKLKEHIEPRKILWPSVLRLVFLPVGIAVLYFMQGFPATLIRQLVGAAVLVATTALVLIRPAPRASLPQFWNWIVFPLSGFLHGLLGMGGPPLVMWVQAHDWTTKQSRGFLFAMFTINLFPAIAMLYYTFGDSVFAPSLAAALTFPALWLTTELGIRAGTKLGSRRLRTVTIGLLWIVGLAGLLTPWLR